MTTYYHQNQPLLPFPNFYPTKPVAMGKANVNLNVNVKKFGKKKEKKIKMVNLISNTGETFKVDFRAVKCSRRLMNTISYHGGIKPDFGFYLSNIKGPILRLVGMWMEHHKFHTVADFIAAIPSPTPDIPNKVVLTVTFSEWDSATFRHMDHNTLQDVFQAAYDLEIPGLIEMCRKATESAALQNPIYP